MITIEHYFAVVHPLVVPESHQRNAERLLELVNAAIRDAVANEIACPSNPKTGTQISGWGGGGYRSRVINNQQTSPRSSSRHLTGEAIDLYDP